MERLKKGKDAILGWLRAHPRITICLALFPLLPLVLWGVFWECLKGAWSGLREGWETEWEGIRELWAYIRKLWKMTKGAPSSDT